MKKRKIQEKIATYIGAIIYIAAGMYVGIAAAKMMKKYDNPFVMVAVLIAFALSMFIGIIIHEGGHLVFGLLSGYKFLSFRVGNIILIKKKGKFCLKKFSIAGTGGQCLLSPPDMVDGKIPYVLYNFGGAIMNIFSALVFYLIYIFTKPGIVSEIMLIFVAISIAMALTNGIPLKNEQIANDGYNAISLGRDNASLRAFWLQLKVNSELANDVMLKNMPKEWFRLPSDEEMKNSMIAVEGVFYCNYLMANCEFEKAEQTIKSLLSKDTAIVGVHKGILRCDLIYCMIIRGAQKTEIDNLLTEEQRKFMKAMETNPSVIRTWYAYNKCVLEDDNKADKTIKEFEKVAKTYPYPADTDNERILLKLIDERYIMQ